MLVSELSAVVDKLVGLDPATLGDGETVVELHRQLERLTAVTTRATAAFDASGDWQADGARTAGAWVAARCGLPAASARRRLRLGRDLRHMAAVEAAWLAGDIGDAHVGLLSRARTPATAQAFGRDEDMLVGQARRLRFGTFARVLAYWTLRADPDGAEERARAQHDARRLHLSRSFGGTWVLDGLLDPVDGSIVAEELRRIDDELFRADWAEARERLGEEARAGGLARTAAQRRADALVEMAARSASAPAVPSRCSACSWATRPSPA